MSRSVLVTGANSGIGLATTLELAAAGYEVIGSVRSAEKAATLDAAAAGRGVSVRTVLMDVADESSVDAGMATVADLTGGGVWAVVNNAGFAQAGAIEDVPIAAAREQLAVNLLAPARVAQLALPAMRAAGDGRIVNVSSIAGRVGLPLLGWYCASKHGLEAMTDALRIEVADAGVKVVLVEPGGFGTGIWAGARYPDDSHRHAAAYHRARSGTRFTARFLPDPVWVARTVRVALGSPVPLPRYLVGVDAVGGVIADRLAPTVVGDLVKGIVAGVRRLPLGIPGR